MRMAPLAPAELAHIPEFIDKWIGIGGSTQPIDRDRAEEALARFYAFAGLAAPGVVWAPCPISAALSAAVYAAIIAGGPGRDIRDPYELDLMIHRVTRFGLAVPRQHLPYEAMLVVVRHVVARALRLRAVPPTGRGPWALYSVRAAITAASRAAHDGRLHPSLEASLARLLVAPIEAGSEAAFAGALQHALQLVIPHLDRTLRPVAEAPLGAPFALGYAGQMDYANRVLGIVLDRSFIDLVEGCGLFWVFDGLCIAAERPTHINRDDAGRLHGEAGPSIAFRSGWSWWHWHGHEVDRDIIEDPQRITVAAIERMPPSELRGIMIERYCAGDEIHGIPAYLRDAGDRLDHDELFGTLWRRSMSGSEPLVVVEVVNRTPEPDGSYKRHFLRVDPHLRPILADGSFGPPQPPTARNAVASTFGLTGAEYKPEIET